MSRHRTNGVLIAVIGVLTAIVAFVPNLLTSHPAVIAWLNHQRWYSTTILVLVWAGLVTAIIAIALWQYRITGGSERVMQGSPAPLDPALRLKLLDKVQRDRVDPRLSQGLRRAIRVDLGLTEIPDVVQSKLRVYVELESGAVIEQPIVGSIKDIFERTAGGRLLILGEPGTGKTNLLLELASSLIENAKHDETLPIPVVFNLPRWTLGKRDRTLTEWLKDDLAREYGVSRTTADALVTQNLILPLLDGLDEVSQERRAACVDAINTFQHGRDLGRLAVCCRTAEYADIPKLELGAAVRVEKLVRADIEREIEKPGLEYVKSAMACDPQLWEIIDTPLRLHVLYGAAQVEPSSGDKSGDPIVRLYARYVEYALGRDADGSPRKRTARELMLRWLGWLAAGMRRRSQSQFAFEDLDASWIPSKRGQWVARWFSHFVPGLVGGLAQLFSVLALVLVGALAVGIGAVLGVWPVGVRPVGALVVWLGTVLFGGLVEGLDKWLASGLVFWLVAGPVVWMGIGLGVGLLFGLERGLQPPPVSGRSAPNRAAQQSLRYALRIGLSSVTIGLLGFGVLRLYVRYAFAPRLLFGIVALFGVMLALKSGGWFALRYYITRLFLWWFRLAPLQYVRFLAEATERLFLIRRGGSHGFLHITFRDYMANVHGPNADIRAAAKSKSRAVGAS